MATVLSMAALYTVQRSLPGADDTIKQSSSDGEETKRPAVLLFCIIQIHQRGYRRRVALVGEFPGDGGLIKAC